MALLDFVKKKKDQLVGAYNNDASTLGIAKNTVLGLKDAARSMPSRAVGVAQRIPKVEDTRFFKGTTDFMSNINTRPLSSRADSTLGKLAGGIIETPYTFLTSVPKTAATGFKMTANNEMFTKPGIKKFGGMTLESGLDTASMGLFSKANALRKAGMGAIGSRVPAGTITSLIKQGAKQGLKTGGAYGAGYGLSEGLKQGEGLKDIAKRTATGGATGALLGGVLGGGIPASSGLYKAAKHDLAVRRGKSFGKAESLPERNLYRDVATPREKEIGLNVMEKYMTLKPDTLDPNAPLVPRTLREIGTAMPRMGMNIEDVSARNLKRGKSKAYKVMTGQSSTKKVAELTPGVQEKTQLPKDINATSEFFKKTNSVHPKEMPLQFVDTLHNPDSIVHFPTERRLNFFDESGDGYAVGTRDVGDGYGSHQSVTQFTPRNKNYIENKKKTGIPVFSKRSGGAAMPSSSPIESAPPAVQHPSSGFSGVGTFDPSIAPNGGKVNPDRLSPVSSLRQMGNKQAPLENQKKPQIKAEKSNIKAPISSQPYKEVNPFEAYSAQGQKSSPVGTKLRTVFQDRMASQKKLQQQPGVKVEEGANPYQAEELFHGRVGSRVEQATKEVETTFRGMADYAKKSGIEFKQLRGAVNRFLQSKHTAERNALHGDGAAGLTNQQADEILSTIGSSEHGTAVAKFADELSSINTKTLDILQESGILSKAQVDTMRTAYKNHVPLQRIMDEGDDVLGALGGGKGYSVQSSGVKKAVGSEREVNDIAGNILANYEQAIIRAEKNRYGQNVLKFAQNNKDTGLFDISTKGAPDNNTLSVFVDGEKVNVKIKNDQLAATLRGVDIERIPELLRPVAAVTRFFSSMATRYNPEFVLSNIIRDSQELAVYIASQADMPKGSVGKVTRLIPESANDVRKALAGDFSSEGSKLYQQMITDGGTTGGLGLSTRKQVQLDISKLEKLVQSKPRQAAQYLAQGIDNWNQVFEDATRLSAYKQAIASGLSRERAASIAKNSTVNFNRKGTSGPVINALYMFSNASIQGSAKMLIAMKNPKVAAVTTAAVAAPVFVINQWNDNVDPEWRDKVSDWDRQSNLVVMVPSDEGAKYFTIPVSWGLKPIKVIADQTYDIATGKAASKSEIAGKIVTAFTESYNPVGGTDLVSAAVPTVLDTPVDIARNQKWSGSMIRSDKELVSNHENYFGSLNNSPLGQATIGATAKIAEVTDNKIDINPANLTYALQQLIGGAGRSAERFLTTATAPVRDGELESKDIPFVNRFYKTVPDEQIEKSLKYKDKDSFEKNLKKLKNGSEEQKAYIQEYLWTKPKEDRGGIMYGLQLKGVMTKGLTTKDEPDAVIDREKENFKESGENFRDKGDYILRRDANGGIRKESRLMYDTAVSAQKLADLKRAKDADGWKKEATTLYRLYMKQLEEPSMDELEKMKIQAKIDTLITSNSKVKSYGGFTKPKKAKKVNIPSINDADFIVKKMSSKLRPLRAFGRSRTNLASVSRPNIRRPKRLS